MATLTIRDETLGSGETGRLTLEMPGETMTLRALLRERVYQEVDDHNRRVRGANAEAQPYGGLVTPSAVEKQLNGPRTGKVMAKEVDWRGQFDAVCEAFERNGFLVLVDEKQVGDLDETLELRPTTEVSFVKLTMLVGG